MKLMLKQLAVSLLLAALSLGGAQAASPPEGIDAGKWVLSPYWGTSAEYNDNLLTRVESNEQVSELIHSVQFGVTASMPFKNSLFEIEYGAEKRKYQDYQFSRDLAQRGRADLRLNGSYGDTLRITESYTREITTVVRYDAEGLADQPNEEFILEGVPYNLNIAEVELSRDNPNMQGYSIKVRRTDHTVVEDRQPDDPDQLIALYNYWGYDGIFEYRHPLPSNTWLIAYHNVRYFNHIAPMGESSQFDPIRCVSYAGKYFRSEHSDSYQIGVRGYIGGRHAYLVRAGLGNFEYGGPVPQGSDFRGLVGRANFLFILGGRSDLQISLERRPLPSYYKTHYIINVLRLSIDREWLRGLRGGLSAYVSRNTYGDPLDDIGPSWEVCRSGGSEEPDCGGARRVDLRVMLEGHLDWMIHDLVKLRLSASHWQRESNCDDRVIGTTEITAGIMLGWE
jgi:hypothetical protein